MNSRVDLEPEAQDALDRVLKSRTYRRSEQLRNILIFLCASATEGETGAGEAEIAELARNAGLPLHHLVRAELACGASLVGKLVLHEAALWVETARPKRLRLRIGDADFTWDEIVSCVRRD